MPAASSISLKVIESGERHTHVALIGRLDTQGVDAIEVPLSVQTATRRLPTIVDLAEVSFLASLGMGMLVRISKNLRSCGAGLVLLNPQEPVERALCAARIVDIIPIVHAQEEALRMLRVE